MTKQMSRTVVLAVLVAVAVTTVAAPASAQKYYRKENTLYVEVFGSGGELSLGYEKLISSHLSIHVGVGGTGVVFREGLAIPFGVSYLIGADRDHLEFGVGGSYLDFKESGTDDVMFDITEDQLVGTALIGYRFIGHYGYSFRLAFTPVITKDGFEPMGGAMFGYSF